VSAPEHGEEIEFSTFVISLASNAAMQLDPDHRNYDLTLARQNIDILAMLERKTAGNLTKEEQELLRGLLYQTRVAYADAARAAAEE
jgi:hypothetical protein